MKVVKHIIKEGSREHVISWHGGIDYYGKTNARKICSEPNCEINYPTNGVGDEI